MTEQKGLFDDEINEHEPSSEHQNSITDSSLEFPETENYLAFNSSRVKHRQTRLDIRRRDGTGSIIYYGYIATIEYTGNENISLIYQDSVFTLTGKNLKKLREALQDERVRYVQEALINTQVEPGQPIIESITQTHLRDQELAEAI